MRNKEANNGLPDEFVERVKDYFEKYTKPKLDENQRWRDNSTKLPTPAPPQTHLN